MKRLAMGLSLLMLATALLGLSACASNENKLKVADVYVSYETRETPTAPAVQFGPKKVSTLVIEPDKVVMYFEDNRGAFLPIDNRLTWFKWSEKME